jgi:hypothetical protein
VARRSKIPSWVKKSLARNERSQHNEPERLHKDLPVGHNQAVHQHIETPVEREEVGQQQKEEEVQHDVAVPQRIEVPVVHHDRSRAPSPSPQPQSQPRPHWTWEEEAILDILRDQRTHNMRWPNIGVEMERGHMSCTNHFRDMCSRRSLGMPDLKPRVERPWTNGEDAQLIWLRSQEMSWEKIAQRHRRNRHSCHLRYLTLPGAEPPKASAIWQTAEKDLLWDMRRAGSSFQEIAQYLPRRRITDCEHMYSRLLRERRR